LRLDVVRLEVYPRLVVVVLFVPFLDGIVVQMFSCKEIIRNS
jgi:hypothetical protein